MPRPSIQQLRGIGDFQTLYRWQFQVVAAPAAVAGFPASEDLNLRCESTALPYRKNDKIDVTIRGHKLPQNGITTYGDNTIKLVFAETVDGTVKKLVKAYHDALWNTTTGAAAGSREDLSFDFLLTLMDNQDQPVWEYKIIGAQLDSDTPGELGNGERGDIQKPELTFHFLKFEDKQV